MRQNIRKGWKMDGKQPNPPPTTQRWWSRAGAAMRGAMELGGKNHKNRGFFCLLGQLPVRNQDSGLRLPPCRRLGSSVFSREFLKQRPITSGTCRKGRSDKKKPRFLWFLPPSSMAPRIAAPARDHHRCVVEGGGFGCFPSYFQSFPNILAHPPPQGASLR